MRHVRRTSPEIRMEMAPLIDVIFLLLTFFVFALVLMVRADVLDVTLPKLSSAQRAERGEYVTVTIDAAGGIFVDGESVEIDTLAQRVAQARGPDEAKRVLVASDEEASSGSLMRAMNELVGAGISDLGLVGRTEGASGEAASDERSPPSPGPE